MQQPRGDLQVQVATIPGSVYEDRTTLVTITGGRRPSSPLPQRAQCFATTRVRMQTIA